eukprot:s32_g48.t1
MLQCTANALAFLCQNINVLARVMTCHDPMSVMCFSALCLAIAGHVLSSLVSSQRSATRKYMILCRKVRAQRHRQCRMMMRRHSCITAVDLRRYATEIDRNRQYLQHLHAMTANLRGGAGGGAAQVTKRKRNQRDLLTGLQELPERFADQNAAVPSQKSKKPDTLLDALKKTLQRAQQNPRNLLQSLTNLVKLANEGKIQVDENTVAPATKQTGKATQQVEPKNPPATWADKVRSPPAAKAQPKQKNATVANQKQQPVYRLWTSPETRSTIATAHHVRKEFENGKMPVATLVATNHELALELKTLAQAHGFTNMKLAAVLTYGDAPSDLQTQWVHVNLKGHGPEIKKFPVLPIGASLPTFPTCQVAPAAMPDATPDAMTLRVTIPFCFCHRNSRSCQSKPANIVSGMLRDYDLQKSFITTYGWRTLQSQQWTGFAEAVAGFLKIDKSNLENVLRISGKHGVFIEHLAQNRPGDSIEWIPQERDEDDMAYFTQTCD